MVEDGVGIAEDVVKKEVDVSMFVLLTIELEVEDNATSLDDDDNIEELDELLEELAALLEELD